MGVMFDVDHDFEGPRAPKAHLDAVLSKPVIPRWAAPVFTRRESCRGVSLPSYYPLVECVLRVYAVDGTYGHRNRVQL